MNRSYRNGKNQRQRYGTLAALDVGSSKIACLIAESDGATAPIIKGIAQHASNGMRRGEVVNIEELSRAIGKTIEMAENMAGLTIETVFVGLAGGEQKSELRHHETEISNGEVTSNDIARLHRMDIENEADANTDANTDDGTDANTDASRIILHRLPIQYTLDGVRGIHEPRAMNGRKLGVDFAVITAAKGTIDNLTAAIERNHVSVEAFAANTYLAGLSCLVEDEKDLGATVIEMGAEVTSIGIFMEGCLVYVDSIPIGGQHVTSDIARGLSTPMDEAERIKTLHGSVLTSACGGGNLDGIYTSNDSSHIILPSIGDLANEAPPEIEMSLVGEIIIPPIDEIFEMLEKRMRKNGFANTAGQRILLTGGGVQMAGMKDYAASQLGRYTRIGKPLGLVGLNEGASTPAFAAAAGLLRFVSTEQMTQTYYSFDAANKANMFRRITHWFNRHI